MSIKVKTADEREVIYGKHAEKRVVISSELMEHIGDVNASINPLDRSTQDYKEQLVSEVAQRIGDDAQQTFELVIYARVELGMHPRDLMPLTCKFDAEMRKIYHAISLEMGRERQRRTGVR